MDQALPPNQTAFESVMFTVNGDERHSILTF